MQRKLSRRTEGASILVCPVHFVHESAIVFLRMENAIELAGMLEIKLYSRFIVLLIGPQESEKHLLQIGRTIATILTDDICREFAYSSKDSQDVMEMVNRFMHDTYVIPPSEWDPSIRIEPPLTYMSKVTKWVILKGKLFWVLFEEQRKSQAPKEHSGQTDDIDLTLHTNPILKASNR